MKKIIALCLVLTLLFAVRPVNIVRATGNAQLSTLSDEAILAFLDEYDVEIPEGFARSDEALIARVRRWIVAVEDNPNAQFSYNFTDAYVFSNAVKDAVNSYYGITPNSGLISTFAASAYTLQQSTLWSIPTNPYAFNCYGYALGSTTIKVNPGHFKGISYSQAELNELSIETLANYVVADLRSEAFNRCVTKTETRPDYDDLASGQTAICIRRGEDDDGNVDYHLARLFYETENEYGDAWRHKPGNSYILQFNNYPSNSTPWIAEGYYATYGPLQNPDGLIYASTIFYILFYEDCSYQTPVLIDDYHNGYYHYYVYTKTCRRCGVSKTYTLSEPCTDCGGGNEEIMSYHKEDSK